MDDDPFIYHWDGLGDDPDLSEQGNSFIDEDAPRNRCWEFRSTSKAFCEALDKKAMTKNPVGFVNASRSRRG